MKWLLLPSEFFFEIIALVFMKKSAALQIISILLVLLFTVWALGCLFLSSRQMDTSIAYAIWPVPVLIRHWLVCLVNEPVTTNKNSFYDFDRAGGRRTGTFLIN